MPYVNVKTAGRLTKEQKSEIAEKFSAVLFDVAGKKPETTYIVFEDVDRENWAAGGKLLSE